MFTLQAGHRIRKIDQILHQPQVLLACRLSHCVHADVRCYVIVEPQTFEAETVFFS
jgi:hypothetical protein